MIMTNNNNNDNNNINRKIIRIITMAKTFHWFFIQPYSPNKNFVGYFKSCRISFIYPVGYRRSCKLFLSIAEDYRPNKNPTG